jgi:hypothetical protein
MTHIFILFEIMVIFQDIMQNCTLLKYHIYTIIINTCDALHNYKYDKLPKTSLKNPSLLW